MAEIARLTRLAARRGLYVLVDMHQDEWSERYRGNGAPEWATLDDGILFPPVTPGHPYDYLEPAVGRAFTSFWENRDGIRSRFVAAFARLARELRPVDRVLGYDAFNEPSCEIQRAPCGLPPEPAAGAKWLKPFYDELVPAMRAADPRHPVFYEDFLTTAFGYPSTLGDAARRGHGLSYHVYCPHPLRSERSCEDLEREAVERSVASRRERRVAPLLTEFGATDDLAVVGRIAALADAAGQSWHYWQYKTYFDPTPRPAPARARAPTPSRSSTRAARSRRTSCGCSPARSRNGSRARRALEFDPATGAFDLRYRARRGGRSQVSLPSRSTNPRLPGAREGRPRRLTPQRAAAGGQGDHQPRPRAALAALALDRQSGERSVAPPDDAELDVVFADLRRLSLRATLASLIVTVAVPAWRPCPCRRRSSWRRASRCRSPCRRRSAPRLELQALGGERPRASRADRDLQRPARGQAAPGPPFEPAPSTVSQLATTSIASTIALSWPMPQSMLSASPSRALMTSLP